MDISALVLLATGLWTAPAAPQQAPETVKGFVLPPSTFRVGAFGPGCDFSSLQQAIDAAQDRDRILVATDAVFPVQATINHTLTIIGGYDSCLASEPGDAQTQLTGLGTGSVLSIIAVGLNVNPQIILRNLNITAGSGPGGGGIYADGDLDLTLENITLRDNQTSGPGGGLMLFDRVRLRVAGALRLSGNTGENGGGLYCEESSISVEGTLSVNANSSAQVGGAALRGCALTAATGSRLQIDSNQGDTAGGLRLIDGSTAAIDGEFQVRFNESRLGSAISVIGAGSALQVSGPSALVVGNVTQTEFGGIGNGSPAAMQVSDQALVRFIGDPAGCSLTLVGSGLTNACSGFVSNRSSPAVGAIRVSNSSLVMQRTFFGANESGNGHAQAIHALGGASVDLQANVFFDHAGAPPLIIATDAQVSVIASTFVNNASESSLIDGTGEAATVELHALVTYENAGDLLQVSGGATASGTCLYVEQNADAGGLAIAGAVTPADMRTPDVAERDFAPSASSQFLDACSDEVHPQLDRDIVGMTRPIDLPDVPNLLGPYDAGAFERNEEIVWLDGFEGG